MRDFASSTQHIRMHRKRANEKWYRKQNFFFWFVMRRLATVFIRHKIVSFIEWYVELVLHIIKWNEMKILLSFSFSLSPLNAKRAHSDLPFADAVWRSRQTTWIKLNCFEELDNAMGYYDETRDAFTEWTRKKNPNKHKMVAFCSYSLCCCVTSLLFSCYSCFFV